MNIQQVTQDSNELLRNWQVAVGAKRVPQLPMRFSGIQLAVLVSCLILPGDGCVASQSSPPIARVAVTTLVGVPGSHVVQWPSVALRADTVYVAGNVFDGEALKARPAYIGRLLRNVDDSLVPLPPLELPAGDFQFAYPRVVPTTGALHLIWAEFATRPLTRSEWYTATYLRESLWHATLTNGTWSTPVRITSGEILGWNDEVGGVVAGRQGSLHVVSRRAQVDSIPLVYDFRMTGDRWEGIAVAEARGLTSATAVAAQGDTLIAAFVNDSSDPARVVLVRSGDDGRSWAPLLVMPTRPRSQASVSRIAIAATPKGLVLVVGEKPDDSFFLDTIRVHRIRGTRVTSTVALAAPQSADQFVVAATRCGAVVMLTRSFSTSPQVSRITLRADEDRPIIVKHLKAAGFSTSRYCRRGCIGYHGVRV